mgnify:FL=1
MSIKNRIPKDFYKLFNSKYMEYYQLVLLTLYEESGQSYSLLGLTEDECQDIINEEIAKFTMDWSQDQFEDEGELLTRSNMASIMLRRLEEWGWLHKDYDETLNQYVVSFPDYSQMFVDVFQRLFSEDNSMERESILAVYSHLFTYSSDKEKNNDILKSALQTSKALLQMLANMQEGIRGYFESLSQKNTFLGIQEVLVNEMNNTYSVKYAILTTTDSFYRYKEEVKELIDKNLSENEMRKQMFIGKKLEIPKDSAVWHRNERAIDLCDEAMEILFQINREFDSIERRYNRLIDQKRTFAKRAAARIRYILVEGNIEEDRTKALVRLLNNSSRRGEILDDLGQRFGMTERFQVIKEKSFMRPRDGERAEFTPQRIETAKETGQNLEEFVVKPLYTHAELQAFREQNEVDGAFQVTEQTVQSVEDLEKLLFVWQEATEVAANALNIEIGEEFKTEDGMQYSGFSIRRK